MPMAASSAIAFRTVIWKKKNKVLMCVCVAWWRHVPRVFSCSLSQYHRALFFFALKKWFYVQEIESWISRFHHEHKKPCVGSTAGTRVEGGEGTDQDLLSGFVLALDLSAQISLGDLQVLSHLPAVLEQRQVALCDPNELQSRGTGAEQRKGSGVGEKLIVFLVRHKHFRIHYFHYAGHGRYCFFFPPQRY